MSSMLNLEFSRGKPSEIGMKGKDWKEALENGLKDANKSFSQAQQKLKNNNLTTAQRSSLEKQAADSQHLANEYKNNLSIVTSNEHSVQFFNQNKFLGDLGNASAKATMDYISTGGSHK